MRLCLVRLIFGFAIGVAAGGTHASAQTISFPSFPANTDTLGAIPDGPGPGCGVAGAPRDVTFMSPPAAGLVSVAVSMTISHAYAGHLTATLVAPDGTAHVLFGRPGALSASDCGTSGDLSGSYEFNDAGAGFWGAAATTGLITPAAYQTSSPGGGAGGGTNVVMSAVFAGKNAGGMWRLRLTDSGAGETGSITSAFLTVTHPRLPQATADTYSTPANVPLAVPAPGVLGNDSLAGGPLTVWDVLFRTPLHGSLALAADGSFTYTPNRGYVGTDLFAYFALSDAGVHEETAVTITVLPASPPTDIEVVSVAGGRVVLRWAAPATGAAATAYRLRWGFAPGQSLGQVPLPLTPTALAIDVPVGVYYVSLRSESAVGPSVFSPAVAINTGVPALPSAPVGLAAAVDGTTVTVHWKNTLAGGAPTGAVLQVTGAGTGVVPASTPESLQVTGVPPGTYTLAVQTTNGSGASTPAPAVTVTVPGTCGVPQMPTRFVAYRTPSGLGAAWDPPATGPAPVHYEVVVSNALSATVPVGLQRVHDVAVASGAYGLRVRAVSACGASPLTPLQTVVVP